MTVRIITGDCREALLTLPEASVQCCVTSPPYFALRDYGVDGQIGLEPTPDEYVAEMVDVFRQVRRVLRDDGTVWLNLGDSYAGSWGARGRSDNTNAPRPDLETKYGTCAPARNGYVGLGIKPKDLLGIPWTVAFALRADGWWLRSAIVWAKPNPMPESVTDRPTSAYEIVFLLANAERYYFDNVAIAEDADTAGQKAGYAGYSARAVAMGREPSGNERPGVSAVNAATRNCRNVWTIATQPYSGAHFATMPPDLAERCIKAGTKPGDTALDPFGGAGTTALVADRLGRNAVIVELNPEYAALARQRITGDAPLFAEVAD
jgi:DNA modification methylase